MTTHVSITRCQCAFSAPVTLIPLNIDALTNLVAAFISAHRKDRNSGNRMSSFELSEPAPKYVTFVNRSPIGFTELLPPAPTTSVWRIGSPGHLVELLAWARDGRK
jgi:hypothetical protein